MPTADQPVVQDADFYLLARSLDDEGRQLLRRAITGISAFV